MKQKNEIFLDLSKLTEEQIKGLVPIIEGAGDKISETSKAQLLEGGVMYNNISFPWLTYALVKHWRTWIGYGDRTEITYTEFLELFGKTEQLEDSAENAHTCKENLQIDEAKKLLEENGYFVFPKAEEGDFPDLSGFNGEGMQVYKKFKNEWFGQNVLFKRNGFFFSEFEYFEKVRPLKQTLTYQELVEKIGLERAKELAKVDKETEIK